MLEQKLYEHSVDSYTQSLPSIKEKILQFQPEKATLIQTPVTPYSISIVAGIPLYRTHNLQRDYNALIHDIREMLPHQFPYDSIRSHLALGVLIRNSPGSNSNSHAFVPQGRKKEFYAHYLDVFRSIEFQPFSLKVEGFYPNGIMLFEPVENRNQVFDIRSQIVEHLYDKKLHHPELFFETEGGKPKIDTGIIHSTFLRFADKEELCKSWTSYVQYIKTMNDEIKSGKLFSDPIVIDEIAFIEPRVSREISTRDWYSDEIIETRTYNDISPDKRIKTIEEIVNITHNARIHGKKIVTTNGSYDLLHAGHTKILEQAKKEGDLLIVLLNSDESIRRMTDIGIKDEGRPIISEHYRAVMLANQRSVDYVVIFPQDNPLDYLTQIKPDVHVKGGSGVPERFKEEREFIEQLGGTYKLFSLEPGLSTTNIVNKILGKL